jgi:hypothetical protein
MRVRPGLAISCQQAAGLITPVAFAFLMVAVPIAQPALGADLDYGPYGPQPYSYQQPPYDGAGAAYPLHRYLPSRQGSYSQYRYTYQSPPYGYDAPAYPPHRYISPPHEIYREGPYEYEAHEYRAPEYPPRRFVPYRNGYRPYGYPDQYYDARRGPAAIELEPARPPAPILGSRRGPWVAHPLEIPDNTNVEAVPPRYAWPAEPRRW